MEVLGRLAPTEVNNAILLLSVIVPAVYGLVQGAKRLVSK